ncbi:MAG: GNAT family N-acetyltransferase [Candidatus Andersenbacteria bacterium]
MQLPIEIKPLKRKELRELLLVAKVYYPTEPWLTLEWLESIERRATVALIARWSTRIVGGLIATPDRYPTVWLDFMVVDRNVSRRGIGEALFVHLERELAHGTMLWHLAPSSRDFKGTHKFLDKMRMEPGGQLKKWFAGKQDALAFSKKIR